MCERYQNIRWLQKVYIDFGWTQTRIADECDVSVRTVGNWLDKFGLVRNRHDREWLADKYVREQLSQREIADLCDTGSSTIGDQLRKYEISRDRNYRQEDWLRERYVEQERSIQEVSDLVGVGAYAIRYWLVHHGVERRSQGPAGQDSTTDSTRLKRWSRAIKERDNHTCVSCSSGQNLHAHHIVPRYEDRSEEMVYGIDNGETLCQSCHAKRHRDRGDERIATLIRHQP
ncbi:HNH endonuclease [Halorarius litoreus]|uniref:HNH endonuclease n=1 Tax=Halorarius litoreus TaxID=2962676 RepID=UPI0020CF3B9D|nr:HNH endonuclease signature motif containing protein [Halorarius litoreus]